jgi:hypothetical protein
MVLWDVAFGALWKNGGKHGHYSLSSRNMVWSRHVRDDAATKAIPTGDRSSCVHELELLHRSSSFIEESSAATTHIRRTRHHSFRFVIQSHQRQLARFGGLFLLRK